MSRRLAVLTTRTETRSPVSRTIAGTQPPGAGLTFAELPL